MATSGPLTEAEIERAQDTFDPADAIEQLTGAAVTWHEFDPGVSPLEP